MKRINLFIKIYLAFWLTILITVSLSVYLERLMTTAPMIKQWQNAEDRNFFFYAEQAAAIYDHDSNLYKDSVLRLEKTTGIKVYLFNDKGVEIAGQTAQQDIRVQVAAALRTTTPIYVRSEKSGMAVRKVKSPGGHTYLFAAVFPHPKPPGFALGPPPMMSWRPPPGPPPFLPIGGPRVRGFELSFFIRLMLGLLVTGILCYLLARYLTAPIFKLRDATKQLADGDLSVRVKPILKGRGGEIASLANNFDIMAEHIEILLTSQRDLLRDVSHELRSPLARLNVAMELCRQHSNDRTQKHLDRMTLETQRLNDLIGQILAYNKMNAEAITLQKTKLDLSELVEEIVEDANYETNNSRTVIRLNESVIINGNHDLLRRAIENIIRNALYHTPEKSIIEISSAVSLMDGKPNVQITVRDHGPGVPEEELFLIFKPFYKRMDSDGHHTGAGLGLAISDAAIHLHNGVIKAGNADDGGLIIEVFLPIESPAPRQ